MSADGGCPWYPSIEKDSGESTSSGGCGSCTLTSAVIDGAAAEPRRLTRDLLAGNPEIGRRRYRRPPARRWALPPPAPRHVVKRLPPRQVRPSGGCREVSQPAPALLHTSPLGAITL